MIHQREPSHLRTAFAWVVFCVTDKWFQIPTQDVRAYFPGTTGLGHLADTLHHALGMSALLPIADIRRRIDYVR
jgi:hypothetical protein